MTAQPLKPRCRWFQFSLRTLLIAVMLVAGLLLAWRVYVEPYQRHFANSPNGLTGGSTIIEPSGSEAGKRLGFSA